MKYFLLITVVLSIFFQGCYVNSTMQGARLIPKNSSEITVSYTHSNVYGADKSFGIQYGHRTNLRNDIRFRYERILLYAKEKEAQMNFVCIEPKHELVKDALAYSTRIGLYFDKDFSKGVLLEVGPTIHYTYSIFHYIDCNFSSRFPLCVLNLGDRLGPWLGDVIINFSTAFSTNWDKYAIRPEIGLIYHIGYKETRLIKSLGFSFYF